jgi:F-type H+-transporting ATPase subunit delta
VKNLAISRRYAKALLLIGKENGQAEAYRKELDSIAGLVSENRDLEQIIVNPLHDPVSRKKILMAIIEKMNASATLKAFLLLLYDKGRFGFLASVNDVYKRLADDLKGVARASLVSAAKLSSETVEKIRGTLSKRTGKDVILDAGEDPDLIGGVVTRIGDLVLDGSIKTQLLNMRESLKRGERA